MPVDIACSGILVVNKHAGVTSHDIVNKVRRLYKTKQVGHTGTLDPMATGVLPVLVGRAVKASDYLTAENKRYRALLRLGTETDTEDITGRVTAESDIVPTEEAVREIAGSFVGDILQTPPMYSAIKVGGRKLVDIAREGGTVEREPRRVTVYSIKVTRVNGRDYELDVSCSKGTYIRTLCADIGRKLGCGGVMASLERTESGPFQLADAVGVEELENMADDERAAKLIPLERFFSDLPEVVLPDFYARLSRNGAEIYLAKIKAGLPLGQMVRLKHDGEFYGLGEVREYPGGNAIRTVKLFVLPERKD